MREFWNGLATVRKVSPQLRTARHSGDSAKWFLFQAEPPSVLTLTVRHKGRDTLTTLSAWKKKKKNLAFKWTRILLDVTARRAASALCVKECGQTNCYRYTRLGKLKVEKVRRSCS